MSAIDQAMSLIRQMDRHDKARLLAMVAGDPDVQFQGIAITPGVSGGAPRISGTRIPVWVLVALRNDGATDDDIIRAYPQLNAEHISDAWAFADQNRELISEQIADNEAA